MIQVYISGNNLRVGQKSLTQGQIRLTESTDLFVLTDNLLQETILLGNYENITDDKGTIFSSTEETRSYLDEVVNKQSNGVDGFDQVNRIFAKVTSQFDLSTSDQTVPFDNAPIAKNIVNNGGELTFSEQGLYAGNVDMYATESANPDVIFWLEKKSFGGSWELIQDTLINRKFWSDGKNSLLYAGSIEVDPGDTVRFRMKIVGGGSASLVSQTETTDLGTITQPACTVNLYKVN
jgi:hypothetical protein